MVALTELVFETSTLAARFCSLVWTSIEPVYRSIEEGPTSATVGICPSSAACCQHGSHTRMGEEKRTPLDVEDLATGGRGAFDGAGDVHAGENGMESESEGEEGGEGGEHGTG